VGLARRQKPVATLSEARIQRNPRLFNSLALCPVDPLNKDHLVRWLPFLAWPRPTALLLRGEAMAGLTVALVMVPQAVAYAALAGMPLVTGFYASLLPTLVAVLWGSSTRLSVGPTALTCLLVGASITGLAEPGSTQWVALAVWLAILSGGLQLALGIARWGWLLNLISSPVLTGFTQAAALLIIASQLPALLGLDGSLMSLLAQPKINAFAAAMGLAGVAMLVVGKRLWPNFPMIMLVVVGAAVVSYATGFEARGGAVVGSLPSGLPALQVAAGQLERALGAGDDDCPGQFCGNGVQRQD
jgi:SulP family sulfate permease